MKKPLMIIIISLMIAGCSVGGSVSAGGGSQGVGIGLGVGTGIRF
ncbi:hypothetical protein [Pasteurella sp. PK-2025]